MVDRVEVLIAGVPGAHVWIGSFANTNDRAKGTMSSLKHADVIVAGHVTVLRYVSSWSRCLSNVERLGMMARSLWIPGPGSDCS